MMIGPTKATESPRGDAVMVHAVGDDIGAGAVVGSADADADAVVALGESMIPVRVKLKTQAWTGGGCCCSDLNENVAVVGAGHWRRPLPQPQQPLRWPTNGLLD